MTEWNVTVSDKTDRGVRNLLRNANKDGGDLSRFVDRVVGQAIFWETVGAIREQNKDLTAEEAQRLADEAVENFLADHP